MLAKLLKGLLTVYRWVRSFCLNLIFIAVLAFFLVALLSSDQLDIPQGAALLITPVGSIVEERATLTSFGDLLGGNPADDEVLLQDLIDSIEIAGRDEAISSIVLQLDYLQGASLAQLQDMGKALTAFKDGGKTVYAIADNLSQSQYYLATYADEIILNNMGAVNLEGMSSYQYYYAEAIEKLDINVHIFKVGEFKSAVEPFELTGMSDAARGNYEEWLNDSWQLFVADISRERSLDADQINNFINNPDQQLALYSGDTALMAQDFGLVDQIISRPEMRHYLIEKIGLNADGSSFLQVPFNEYLAERRIPLPAALGGNQIGIIIASGTIYDGEQPPGSIGGDTLAGLIRQAKHDENIKALVLRVDSPGGSAFASEVIRSELLDFKSSGKPLVISMGSVAASGGYWIATAADEIWASPATITGSIGIFGIYPTFKQTLNNIGIYVDGVGTTTQAGAYGLGMELPESTQRAIQLNVEKGYDRFLQIVSDARGMTLEEVDAVGQGRVWSANAAFEQGLVDNLGDLDDAVEAAANLAGIEQYRTKKITRPPSPTELIIQSIADNFNTLSWFKTSANTALFTTSLNALYRQINEDIRQLLNFNDPNSLYLQCFSCLNSL
ncbi:MAG: signal peptide peptidase SppA [SAR86 cluster bacterium]|uniref:Signal peptide peptidase SppA n=1 Tax=SAR86 cluster bacterium TaxID=2030880 RepID=A0A2A5CES0_9GAMM|nr:MAG: signal peptide peptidase SppA [SAR86 cluster bacterium]